MWSVNPFCLLKWHYAGGLKKYSLVVCCSECIGVRWRKCGKIWKSLSYSSGNCLVRFEAGSINIMWQMKSQNHTLKSPLQMSCSNWTVNTDFAWYGCKTNDSVVKENLMLINLHQGLVDDRIYVLYILLDWNCMRRRKPGYNSDAAMLIVSHLDRLTLNKFNRFFKN